MVRNKYKKLLGVGTICSECGEIGQHGKKTEDSAIVETTENGPELSAMRHKDTITCRKCGKVTIISGEIPVGQGSE